MTKRKGEDDKTRMEAAKKVAFERCMIGGCASFQSAADCFTCRHNEAEDARRKALPLIKDPETGLYRKYLGIRPSRKKQEGE